MTIQEDRNLRHFGVATPWAERDKARTEGRKTYSTGRPCKHGHLADRRVENRRCVVCDNAATKERCRINHGKYYGNKSQRALADRLHYMLVTSRRASKKRGLEHTITIDDLSMGDNCPCCGVVYETERRSRSLRRTSPSLDRFDNTKGYIPGNVNIICWRCNWVKGNATSDELRDVADWIDSKASRQLVRVSATAIGE